MKSRRSRNLSSNPGNFVSMILCFAQGVSACAISVADGHRRLPYCLLFDAFLAYFLSSAVLKLPVPFLRPLPSTRPGPSTFFFFSFAILIKIINSPVIIHDSELGQAPGMPAECMQTVGRHFRVTTYTISSRIRFLNGLFWRYRPLRNRLDWGKFTGIFSDKLHVPFNNIYSLLS